MLLVSLILLHAHISIVTKMDIENTKLKELLEFANHYPSPHNGQPIELKMAGKEKLDAYFMKERGLQAAEVSFLFSYVTMGVFLYHLSMCAKGLGHKVNYSLHLPPVETLRGSGTEKFASIHIEYSKNPPNKELLKVIKFRQTSRKKYSEGVNDALSQTMIDIASRAKLELVKMNGL
jgi:hypothetical protein